jgi:hypothetical protein
VIQRINRGPQPLRQLAVERTGRSLVPVVEDAPRPDLALRYSNGFVTVEISHDALDAFVEAKGEVPLPVDVDPQNGDKRTYDAKRGIRAIYDKKAKLREVTTQTRDGLYIRVNFPERLENDAQATPEESAAA